MKRFLDRAVTKSNQLRNEPLYQAHVQVFPRRQLAIMQCLYELGGNANQLYILLRLRTERVQ